MAATTSTEISPRVSHARMSTSSTFTAFFPPPKLYAAGGIRCQIGSVLRAAVAKAATITTAAPTAADRMARRTLRAAVRLGSISAENFRSTSTKITNVNVSTRNWVRARSGAPCRAKITPQP